MQKCKEREEQNGHGELIRRWKIHMPEFGIWDPVSQGELRFFCFLKKKQVVWQAERSLALLTRKGRHNSSAFAVSKPMLSASGFLRAIACQQISPRVPLRTRTAFTRDRLSADLFAYASVS